MKGQQAGDSTRIMPGIKIVIAAIVILAFLTGCASAGVFLKNGTDIKGNDTIGEILADADTTPGNFSIEFFYNTHCGACHVAMAYLNEYSAAHPDIIINSHDLFNSSEGKALFEEYKSAYHRSYVSVPSIFMGNVGLEGESSIRENFDPLVSWYTRDRNTTAFQTNTSAPKNGGKTHRTVISIPLVLIAGLIDGINPCASAVLVFLLILLMTIRQRERVVLAGAVFTSAVFFFYFLSGVGIFTISQASGVVKGFSLIAGVLAILAALIILWESIFPGKGITRIIPGNEREKITRIYEKLTLPLVFILGLLLGVLELPCAGGIYITILDMISFRVNIVQGMVYLILYNLAFIIPLILLTGIVCLVKQPDQKEEDEKEEQIPENHRGIRIFIGLLLLVFAFLILSGVL